MGKKVEWLKEDEAAKEVGLSPKYFRRNVRSGNIIIDFTRPSRNEYQYSKESVEKFKLFRSTVAS
jgi:hypothetical protein